MATPIRIFTIRRRAGDWQFVARNDKPGEAPLAIDASLVQATNSAREAAQKTAISAGCRVLIMSENPQGYLESIVTVDPRV